MLAIILGSYDYFIMYSAVLSMNMMVTGRGLLHP
jgi:hypothetical protein